MKIIKKNMKLILSVLILVSACCTLVGMVTGPFGLDSISIKFSGTACVLAMAGIIVSLIYLKRNNE